MTNTDHSTGVHRDEHIHPSRVVLPHGSRRAAEQREPDEHHENQGARPGSPVCIALPALRPPCLARSGRPQPVAPGPAEHLRRRKRRSGIVRSPRPAQVPGSVAEPEPLALPAPSPAAPGRAAPQCGALTWRRRLRAAMVACGEPPSSGSSAGLRLPGSPRALRRGGGAHRGSPCRGPRALPARPRGRLDVSPSCPGTAPGFTCRRPRRPGKAPRALSAALPCRRARPVAPLRKRNGPATPPAAGTACAAGQGLLRGAPACPRLPLPCASSTPCLRASVTRPSGSLSPVPTAVPSTVPMLSLPHPLKGHRPIPTAVLTVTSVAVLASSPQPSSPPCS